MSETHAETAGAAASETTTTAAETTETAAKTFSEADVNRIVQERLARQRAQFPAEDELKTLRERASKLDEIEASNKSELEKAQERAAELEKQAADAAANAKEALLRSAVVAEAARKNVVDPDAAFALIDRGALELGDDGSPTNIAEAMDQLLTKRPYLVGGGRSAGSADLGARGGGAVTDQQLTSDDLKKMTPEQIVKARRDGRLSDVMSGRSS